MLAIKVHEIRRYGIVERVVALCDKELLGKKFEEGELSLYVNPRFYFEKEIEEEKAKEILKEATIANLVGEKAVKLGIESGLVDPNNIIKIQGVPHAQIVVMLE